ncbi:MAG: lysophospholipid acyltransferase family protein [Actinomycetota bacterium]
MSNYLRSEQRPDGAGGAATRAAQRATGVASEGVRRLSAPLRTKGFPLRAPTAPGGVEVPVEPDTLGGAYDTEWAQRPVARVARGLIVEGPLRLFVQGVASPTVTGLDRLIDLERDADERADGSDPDPVIFAPNHHSHLDTAVMIRSIPAAWRRHLVVAAAADYFFDAHWKAALSALSLNAIPIDREATSRETFDRMRDAIADGNSLIIYPEGGRSPDGWGQDFKGGAAYLAARTGAPVVPVFLDGTGELYGKGASRLKIGRTSVAFGTPLTPGEGENTRRFNARIEAAVARLGDEVLHDSWTAARRAADGSTPSLSGPDHQGWRRQWQLADRRRLGTAGIRRRRRRTWPDLG